MSNRTTTISTIVRNAIPLLALRLQFLLGGLVAPEAIARRAGLLFSKPFASSRTRALAAPTLGASEAGLDVDGVRLHTYA